MSDTVKPRSLKARLKNWLRRFPPLHRAARALRAWVAPGRVAADEAAREISEWRLSGSPVPPPDAFKQATVRAYGKAFGLRTLVETGTYLGDMVEAQRRRFRQVLSIELAPDLYRAARARFASARNVSLLEGDSGDLIPSVVAELKEPALFWLDGHYSAGITARGNLDTPVQRELETILGSAVEHVVLVDDARCFGTGDYPSLDAVRTLVAQLRPGWTCVVEDDVIRIHRPALHTPAGRSGVADDRVPQALDPREK